MQIMHHRYDSSLLLIFLKEIVADYIVLSEMSHLLIWFKTIYDAQPWLLSRQINFWENRELEAVLARETPSAEYTSS